MKKQTFLKYRSLFSVIIVLSVCFAVTSIILSFRRDEIMSNEQAGEYTKEKITVIIDAGHGGEDGGAVGISGTLEKDINLALSYKLNELFSLTDIDTVMTRYDDSLLYTDSQSNRKKYYDLRNRAKVALMYDNPVFISIHQNKFPVSKYKGLQVYYSENNAKSKTIADLIQSNVVLHIQNDNNRKTKEAGGSIYLMNALECPAVLIECGFLSNREDEKNLNDEEYQNRLAFVIFSSVMSCLTDNAV